MKPHCITVRVTWVGVQGVWVADSTDFPDLAAEGETIEELHEKVAAMVPGLIESSGLSDLAGLPVRLVINPVY